MNIITNLKEKYNMEYVHILHFHSKTGTSADFMDYDMPPPLTISHRDNGYFISWAFEGYAGTPEAKKYKIELTDKIAKTLEANVVSYLPNTEQLYDPHINNYNEFQLRIQKEKTYWRKDKVKEGKLEDALFDHCRYAIYALKEKNLLYYDKVYSILEEENIRGNYNRPHADIKSKARNMLEWTENNYAGGCKSRKEINADYYTRHKKKSKNQKVIKTEKKILRAIKRLELENKKITKIAVAKIAKINRETVAKHWDKLVLKNAGLD